MKPNKPLRGTTIDLLLSIVLVSWHQALFAQQALGVNQCGETGLPQPTDPILAMTAPGRIAGQYGPYDYRTVTPEIRHRVEDYHFTPIVEQARGGPTGSFGGDVDYTLRAFPNNPRALLAISRFSLTHHTERPPGARYQTECYFERAIRFTPNDPMVHLIYAVYLKDRKRSAEARTQLDEAERLRGDISNFDFDYNLGLLYFDIGAYDKSMDAAARAYALGAPLPALMNKLKSVKKWREPVPVAQAPAAPVSSDAAPETPATAGQTPAGAQPVNQ